MDINKDWKKEFVVEAQECVATINEINKVKGVKKDGMIIIKEINDPAQMDIFDVIKEVENEGK